MRFIFLFSLFLLIGCSRDKEFVPVYNVPEEFQPFVDAFIQEAADRGISLDITNLIIVFDQNLNTICGTCNSISLNEKVQKIISINPNAGCWSVAQGKESLVFHELGHCVLGRTHNNELLPNGDPKSIMVDGNQKLYWPCFYDIDGNGGVNCNNIFKRDYYVNELFDENTQTPDWAR